MTSKKRRKLSYHRILKSRIYLIYHLVKLTSSYFMAEWEPQRTNPGQSFLHSTLIALAYHTHTHTHTHTRNSCELQSPIFKKCQFVRPNCHPPSDHQPQLKNKLDSKLDTLFFFMKKISILLNVGKFKLSVLNSNHTIKISR